MLNVMNIRTGCIGFATSEQAERFKTFVENNIPYIKDSVEVHDKREERNYEYDFAVTFDMLPFNEKECTRMIRKEMANISNVEADNGC